MSKFVLLTAEDYQSTLNEMPFGVDAEAPEPVQYTEEQLNELAEKYT